MRSMQSTFGLIPDQLSLTRMVYYFSYFYCFFVLSCSKSNLAFDCS
jgi:hypothetical protein